MTFNVYHHNGLDNFIKISKQQVCYQLKLLLTMKRLTADVLRKMVPVFQYSIYSSSEDPKQYIHDLLLVVLHKRKINSSILCMNQLNDILIQIGLQLKIKHLHQIYLFSTFQKYQQPTQTKKRLLALVNQQKRKIDVGAVAKWLHQAFQQHKIRPPGSHNRAISSVKDTKLRSISQHVQKRNKVQKLPPLSGSTSQKLQQELKYLITIFEQMEKERQSSGLIPLNLDAQDQQVQIKFQNIPYDPELYELNNKLCLLRLKAEDRLARIIQLAKDEPKVRQKLQEAIQKFQRARIEANQKIGRIGAMKAQKRLIERKRQNLQKFKNMQLDEDEDLVRAAHLHYLMSLQQKKSNKLIV